MIGGIDIREFGKYIHKYDNKFGFSMSVKGMVGKKSKWAQSIDLDIDIDKW